MTHFGVNESVSDQLDQVHARLDEWSTAARGGRDTFTAAVSDAISRDADEELAARYEQAAPVDQSYDGYARYWSKRG